MARKTKKVAGGKKSVDSLTHTDEAKRKNIPTAETQSFMSEEEAAPSRMRYPRNPDLDPQLVWRGKDQEDGEDLVVDTVPIYIQEKIHPRALIEDIKRRSGELRAERRDSGDGAPGEQFGLETFWSDFNGLDDPEAAFEFYEHDRNWTNRMILGDSLLVMNSLAEKEALKGQVQTIYFDPPYGIKFNSNWQVSTKSRDVKDGKADQIAREPEVVKAFRDTWSDGVNTYLSYMRDRLSVARRLLHDTGSIFAQIGFENVHYIRAMLDEVFGAKNIVAQISFQKTGGIASNLLGNTVDYIIWYAKDIERVKYRQINIFRKAGDTSLDRYDQLELSDGF
jgi:adenine-specific DNA-methyltransferase